MVPLRNVRIKPLSSTKTEIIFKSACDTEDINAKFGITLTTEENEVRDYILEQTPIKGSIPSLDEIKKEFPQLSKEKFIRIINKLDEVDVIHLNDEKTMIEAAYPFSGIKTSHVVKIHGGKYKNTYAMCAIDALGVGFMFNKDISIKSKCFHCDDEIHIGIENNEIVSLKPMSTVVWGHMEYSCCAATSLCNNINFFSSTEHFEEWKESVKELQGYILQIQEAFFLGKQFFKERLDL
ncbi:MAG: alkylmercury lyase family protein [Promethearchaeota archaeon]|jgi:hypothetical protein